MCVHSKTVTSELNSFFANIEIVIIFLGDLHKVLISNRTC